MDQAVKRFIKLVYLTFRYHVLKGLSIFFFPRQENVNLKKISKILFIRIDRLGDMVLSTPAFKAIRDALPQVQLIVMASPANASVIQNNPDVDGVIIYNRQASIYEKMKLLRKMRSQKFDLAIDPYRDYELQTALLTVESGAKIRIGHAAHGRELFFNCPAPMTETNKHFIDASLDLLERIGISAERRNPVIHISEEEYAWARKWMQENGFEGKKIVALHPGGYYETQRWSPDYYAELINTLGGQTALHVILFGAPSDLGVVNEIQTKCHHDACTFIEGDLRKFFALLAQCSLLVCNNSGPLHCATALKIPTISFMGPTVKELWMPVGKNDFVLRKDDLSCIGCNLGYCKIKTHACMRLINPEMVLEIILERLHS